VLTSVDLLLTSTMPPGGRLARADLLAFRCAVICSMHLNPASTHGLKVDLRVDSLIAAEHEAEPDAWGFTLQAQRKTIYGNAAPDQQARRSDASPESRARARLFERLTQGGGRDHLGDWLRRSRLGRPRRLSSRSRPANWRYLGFSRQGCTTVRLLSGWWSA
jgi:hypothetical protein